MPQTIQKILSDKAVRGEFMTAPHKEKASLLSTQEQFAPWD